MNQKHRTTTVTLVHNSRFSIIKKKNFNNPSDIHHLTNSFISLGHISFPSVAASRFSFYHHSSSIRSAKKIVIKL